MKMWTLNEGQMNWKQWPDSIQAIESVSGTWKGQVLVYSERPTAELKALIAIIRILRNICCNEVAIIIGSPHPDQSWIDILKEAGTDYVWQMDTHYAKSTPHVACIDSSVQLDERPCPALRAMDSNGVTLSVCGRRNNRWILARHHFHRWCFGKYSGCPNWRGQHEK